MGYWDGPQAIVLSFDCYNELIVFENLNTVFCKDCNEIIITYMGEGPQFDCFEVIYD